MKACIGFALLLICALAGQAQPKPKTATGQTKPDLTGSWMLDRTKSNVGQSSNPDLPLNISHHDPELRIIHTGNSNAQTAGLDLVYYTDGRGETNQSTVFLGTDPSMNPQGHEKDLTKSKTIWSGNNLVTRSTLRGSIAGRILEFEMIDEWKLSADGKTLTQTSKTVFHQESSSAVFIPAQQPDKKRVYNRVN